ncbi:zinc-binding dehydrogenase [Candidatus Bathyarchaeota archaeon]|nr:zinc-binding dehydrogenase [Candidatus Bathyarchaeota archaeon]
MIEEIMQAAMLYGVKDLRVEEVKKPKIGSGEVLVKIKAATTCGTDLKILQRGYLDRIIRVPTVFGHEWAGEVVDVGEGVVGLEKGNRIRAGNSAPCLRCEMCRRGKYNLCEDMLWLWGAYAEYIRVPARTVRVNVQQIPQHVSYEEAAIAEPLACVLHGADRAGIRLGDTVAIIGAGPIGLLHLITAKKLGAARVIISDLVEERLAFARKLGADGTIHAKHEDNVEVVKRMTNGYGADVVVEAIGLPVTWEQALRMVRKGGMVLEFGGCPPGTTFALSTELIHYGEITVRAAFHATPSYFRKAMGLIASGTLNVKQIITRRMPLKEISKAFDILENSKSDLKIAIIP